MNGTEWTEPGKGDTYAMLWRAMVDQEPSADMAVREAWGRAFRALPPRHPKLGKRTNLKLIGFAPYVLTAEDLKRIETCEVAK